MNNGRIIYKRSTGDLGNRYHLMWHYIIYLTVFFILTHLHLSTCIDIPVAKRRLLNIVNATSMPSQL